MMKSANEAFLSTVKNFPRWMEIRKRPNTSVGGLYIKAVLNEQTALQNELDEYIKDFFLLSYIGREDTVLEYAWVATIGKMDLMSLQADDDTFITTDAKYFLNHRDSSILYQDEYIIIDDKLKPKDGIFRYTLNEFNYTAELNRQHIWNVIDEFAMMSGIERQVDETNKQLMKRCFLAFSNPTNSTETGIKHAIENAMTNYVELKDEDIIIETPDVDNMNYDDEEYSTIYERLAQFNQDLFRTKQWDMTTWEHGFMELGYIPNRWDEPMDISQDGVGQMDDLKVVMSGDAEEATTNVSVTGYKTSEMLVDQCVRRHNIKKNIPLKLVKYNDELKSKEVQYRITASEVEEIKPREIFIKTAQKVSGLAKHYLSDIVIDPGTLKVKSSGLLDKDTDYSLVFAPKNPYSAMKIYKANLKTGANTQNLLKPNKVFRNVNGTFQNSNVAANATTLNDLMDYNNIIEAPEGGFTIGGSSTTGEIVMDVTGMDNYRLELPTTCQMIDITDNPANVFASKEYPGFYLNDAGVWVSDKAVDGGLSTGGTMVIDVDANELSFSIPANDDPSKQGSYSMTYTISDLDNPGNKTEKSVGPTADPYDFDKQEDKIRHFHVEITRIGDNPVYVSQVFASCYAITCWTENKLKKNICKTRVAMSLPSVKGAKDILHVKIEAFTNFAPVIQCVHVGSDVDNAYYSLDFHTDKNKVSELDIFTDCEVTLYKNGQIAATDYHTQTVYANESATDVARAIIDTSSFLSINRSSMEINKTMKGGRTVSYITFMPGEEESSIDIDGTSYVTKENRSLSELFNMDKDDRMYVTSNVKGFIIKRKTGQEEIRCIERGMLNADSDSFSYEGKLPTNSEPCFIIDENSGVSSRKKTLEQRFEYTYLATLKKQQYVAYNKQRLYQEDMDHVKIVNTFAPMLDLNKFMYFELNMDKTGETDVSFVKKWDGHTEECKWSLGQKPEGIHIHTSYDFNNEGEYSLSADQLTESFAISSNIALKDTYTINGVDTPLARYIVTPPDDMEIVYESMPVRESNFYPKYDGFNKLYFSNVEPGTFEVYELDEYNNRTLIKQAGNYDVIDEAGIVIWKNTNYAGLRCEAVYSCKKPKSLVYKDIKSLYDIIDYSADAYKKINEEPILLEGMGDGDEQSVSFGSVVPDKIVLHCDNSNFVATLSNGKVCTKLVGQDNTAMVHTGYYYDDDKEYYFFEHIGSDTIDKTRNIEMHYVRHSGSTLKLIQQSSNYVLDTKMDNDGNNEVLCDINFKDENVRGVSDLNAITACDAYQLWQTSGMEVSLTKAWNNMGIHFEGGVDAYALLNISSVAKPKAMITLMATSGLEVSIMKEILVDGESMVKSVFCDPFATFSKGKDILSYTFPDDMDTSCRYYLYVTGTGTIDDIVACYRDEAKSATQVHVKNITALGFNNIKEKALPMTEHEFLFNKWINQFDGLEIDASGVIETGSNVDWGITKVYSLGQEVEGSDITYNNLLCKNGVYYSTDKEGKLTTPKIFLRNKPSILTLYVKVNNVVDGEYKNFDIHVLTSPDNESIMHEVSTDEQVNYASVPAARLGSYVQIEVDSPVQRVIENVEVYVKYAEVKGTELHVTRNTFGTLKSKVYDATYAATFQPVRINGYLNDEENIRLFVRAYRENSEGGEWTKWYECELNDNDIIDGHVFDNYRYFQFELAMYSMEAQAGIESVVFKVVN